MDGSTSIAVPVFTAIGQYIVSVTVTNGIGSTTASKSITVTKTPPPCPQMLPGNNVFISFQDPGGSCSYVPNNGSKVCGATCCNAVNGTCGASCTLTCNGGFADCNGKVNDGCEIDLARDKRNCGECGVRCIFSKCENGACVINF